MHLLVSLVGADGTALAARSIAILPGESAHLRLRGPSDRAGRLLVRAAISVPPPDDGQPPPDDGQHPPDDTTPPPDDGVPPPDDELTGIQATLEIVDVETRRTAVFLNPVVLKGFNPQPEPPGARR